MNTVSCDTDTVGRFPQTLHLREHTFHAGVTPESGGEDSAPTPHDYFDASLASCKALTAIWFAKKHGIPLERVHVSAEPDACSR
jgi:putative redox protein